MMDSIDPAEVVVTVSMNLPGPYPMYSCDLFKVNPTADCRVVCTKPTNIIFKLDQATIDAGWHFAGYAPNASAPMPKHMNLGFSSHFPNHSVTIYNPHQRRGDIHFFSLFYSNKEFNNGAPFSFDPETENGGITAGGGE